MTTATDLVLRIDAELAQTQCRECGYPSCRDYAAAIAAGDSIDKCRPGGEQTTHRLAALLQRPELPPAAAPFPPRVAWIDASRCIGCARCLPPCPVDAIVGFAPYLHTVLTTECTGCGLCLAPCPVDCIELRQLGSDAPAPPPSAAARAHWRARYDAHLQREASRAAAEADARSKRLRRRRNAAGTSALDQDGTATSAASGATVAGDSP